MSGFELNEFRIIFVYTFRNSAKDQWTTFETILHSHEFRSLHEFLHSNQATQCRKENEKSEFQQNAIAAIISLYFQRNFEQCVAEKIIQRANELKKIEADFSNLFLGLDPILRDPERFSSKGKILKFIRKLMKFSFKFMTEDERKEFFSKVADAIFTSCSVAPPNPNWRPVVEALITEGSKVQCETVAQNYGILSGGKKKKNYVCLSVCLSVCISKSVQTKQKIKS